MNNNYTTIEQSKKLLELGLQPDTADMIYKFYHSCGNDAYPSIIEAGTYVKKEDVPCWTAEALMKAMPAVVNEGKYECFIKSCRTKQGFILECSNNNGYIAFGVHSESMTNGLVTMMTWLLENKHM